jgi:RNA polymerase primary sigma factor
MTATATSLSVSSAAPRPVRARPAWERDLAGKGLARDDEAELVRRAQAGDRAATERLIEAHLRLVYSVARRYRCRSHSLEDLVQEGIVGLIMGIERFEPAHGCRLSTYALHWVRQAIARAAGRTDRLIHVPAQTTAEIRRLTRIRDERRQALGREPTDWELAETSGMDEERVRRLLGMNPETVSYEILVGAEQDASLLELAEDPNAVDPEQDVLREDAHEQVRRLVARLSPRERQVLEERFGLNGRTPCTLEELSRAMRLTREGVRQIEARAIRKLRHALRSAQWG